MALTKLDSDVYVTGNLSAQTLTVPANAVTNSAIPSAANIDGYKLKHFHRQVYAQESATTAASESRVVHHCLASGTVTDFYVGSVVVNGGAATVAVDLKKNGSSILSSAVTLSSSNTARVAVAGSISSASVVAGDVLEVTITATAGGGTLAKGVFASVNIHEASV